MKSIRALGRLMIAILRELADDGPYARHLARRAIPHSAAEWRRFSEHRLRRKYARARCC